MERQAVRLSQLNEDTLINHHITWAEDERNAWAKANSASTLGAKPQVHFNKRSHTRHYDPASHVPMITYDSGADGHYVCEADRLQAGLPILHPYTKHVGVANGSISKATNVCQLPFPQLSATATQADSFHDFPHSLMSVGKTCDDGTISIFTQSGVSIHRDQDVLITCKGDPLLTGTRDAHGRYRIPLIQYKGNWQPRTPST